MTDPDYKALAAMLPPMPPTATEIMYREMEQRDWAFYFHALWCAERALAARLRTPHAILPDKAVEQRAALDAFRDWRFNDGPAPTPPNPGSPYIDLLFMEGANADDICHGVAEASLNAIEWVSRFTETANWDLAAGRAAREIEVQEQSRHWQTAQRLALAAVPPAEPRVSPP